MMIENILLLILVISAAIFDYKFRRVPNYLTFPMIISGLALGLMQWGTTVFLTSLLGLALGIALLAFPYSTGGIGAGDVKLLGAVGAMKGPEFVFYAFLGAAIIGGIMALFRTALIIKSSDVPVLRESIKTVYYTGALSAIEIPEYALKEKLPYAVAISGGAIAGLIMGI